MDQAVAQRSKAATVVRVTSGNFLEMFDFFLFGFYASHIARAFFPSENEFASLLFTFMAFGWLPDAPARRHLPRRLC
jgi:MFS transporter, MHS family, citrate/tricarballylate:H+ symporter